MIIDTIPCALQGYLLDDSPRLLIGNHLTCRLEKHVAPSLDKRISLGVNFDNLCLEFLLSGKEAVPEVVSNRALLQQVLKCLFVFA